MTRRKKKNRRGQKRRRASRAITPLVRGPRLKAVLEAVEFARGHDGFLRGNPEPVVVFAGYAVGPSGACLLARTLRRLTVSEPYPSVSKIRCVPERELFTAELPPEYERIVLLGIALEEDSGRDVEAIYTALAQVEGFSAWPPDESAAEPFTFGEAARGPLTAPPGARPIYLIRDGVYLHESCQADDWVGAALAVVAPSGGSTKSWRFHFRSPDAHNDWTALIQIKF